MIGGEFPANGKSVWGGSVVLEQRRRDRTCCSTHCWLQIFGVKSVGVDKKLKAYLVRGHRQKMRVFCQGLR